MKLELVIFDVDGLLLNTEELWRDAWDEIGQKYNIDNFSHDVFLKMVGHSGSESEKIFFEETKNMQIADPRALMNELTEYGYAKIEKEVQLKKGAKELLAYLADKGITMGVATSTFRDLTDQRLKALEVFDYFSMILTGDEVERRKPNPEVYNRIVEGMQSNKENTLILEDSFTGIQAACDAQVPCIMVPDMFTPTQKQLDQTIYVASDLNDVKAYIEKHYSLS